MVCWYLLGVMKLEIEKCPSGGEIVTNYKDIGFVSIGMTLFLKKGYTDMFSSLTVRHGVVISFI
jgi:hypothetical protein